MIEVKEIFKIKNDATVLVCDVFPDEDVKSVIESNLGKHKSFEVEPIRQCFSTAKVRTIVLHGKEDFSGIKTIKFV